MDISIASYPSNYKEIIFMAGRNCYGLPDKEYRSGYIEMLIKNRHESVIEHVNVTVLIKNATRSFMAQLTRHRIASFSIKSQHYVDHSDFSYEPWGYEVLDKEYERLMADIKAFYRLAMSKGYTREKCRQVLPNATYCDIVMTCNMRELRHIIKERITFKNCKEIKEFAKSLLLQMDIYMPELVQDLMDEYMRLH